MNEKKRFSARAPNTLPGAGRGPSDPPSCMTQRITRMSAEKSAQEEFKVEFEYGEDFAHYFEQLNPTVAKVLVHRKPKDDASLNRRQTERLRRFSSYLAKSHHGVRHEAWQRQGVGKRRCDGAPSLDDFDVLLENW